MRKTNSLQDSYSEYRIRRVTNAALICVRATWEKQYTLMRWIQGARAIHYAAQVAGAMPRALVSQTPQPGDVVPATPPLLI